VRKFSCDEARAHLSDALAGVIGRPEANVLEAHLIECDPCRSLSELFLWQDRVLSELAAQARMDQLMSRVRAGLANLDQVAVSEQASIFRYPRRPSWGWMAAAAAFILVLVGVLYWKPAPKNDSLTQVRPPDPHELPAPQPPVESPETAQQTPEPETPAPPIEAPVPQQPAVAQGTKVVAPQVTAPQRVEAPPAKNDASPTPVPAPILAKAPPGGEVVEKPKTLEDAVRNGMAYLRAKTGVFAKETKNDELLLWTYYQGGVPESDPEFQTALKAILEKKLEKTYNVSLQAMLLEDLDRVKHQKRLAQCAQFLLDNQCANGQWSYGDPSIFVEAVVVPPPLAKGKGLRKVPLTKKREGPATGDNSNTMYALLGMRACNDAGIVLPATSVELAAKWWRETQTRSPGIKAPAVGPEGWCYGRHDHKAYGSMTAGGVGSLAICDYILGRDWKKDREVACGMEWLAKNFSVAYNPGPYEHANFEENSQHQYYYYLYALERAAILTGTEQIGPHFWFAKGSQALIDAQRPDGSWKAAMGGSELTDTCFAVLTLRKATRALIDVATLSPTKK
jgi:hypothetical protein